MRVVSDETALQTQGSHRQEDHANSHPVLLSSSATSIVLWSQSALESSEQQSGDDLV